MPDYFKDGLNAYQEGKYNDAINLIRKELEINENNSKAWNLLGICLTKTKKYEDAATSFYNALKLKPDNHTYKKNFNRLEKYYSDSDDIQLDDNIIPHDTQSNSKNNLFPTKKNILNGAFDLVKGIIFLIILFLLISGAWIYVSTSIENSLTGKQTEVISEGAYSAAQNAEKLFDEGRYSEALSAYQDALTKEPNSYSILIDIGRCYSRLGQPTKELEYYNKAIEVKPDSKTAWNNKATTLLGLERYDEAITATDKVLLLDPDDIDILYIKGEALNELGLYEEANNQFEKYLSKKPQDADGWYNKARTLNKLERYEEALKSADKAVSLNLTDAAAWNLKGNVLNNLNRYDEALKAYDKAINLGDAEYAPNNKKDLQEWLSNQ